jgi:RHS repeat-associated protein
MAAEGSGERALIVWSEAAPDRSVRSRRRPRRSHAAWVVRVLAVVLSGALLGGLLALAPNAVAPAEASRDSGLHLLRDGDGYGDAVKETSAPAISDDGRYVAYSGVNEGNTDLLVMDVETRERVTVSDDGSTTGITEFEVAIDRTGDTVVGAPREDNGWDYDGLWAWERDGDEWDSPDQIAHAHNLTYATGPVYHPAITADGDHVVFSAEDDALITADDDNDVEDVFVHDRTSETTTRLSLDPSDDEVDDPSQYPDISADGSAVVFVSESDDLVAGDSNGLADVFVRDLTTDETELVSLDDMGDELDYDGEGSLHVGRPSISGNGRFVVFNTNATNLDAPDDRIHVYLHDRWESATYLISDPTEAGSFSWTSPQISADGVIVTSAEADCDARVAVWALALDEVDEVEVVTSEEITPERPPASYCLESFGGWNGELSTQEHGNIIVFATTDDLLYTEDGGGLYALYGNGGENNPSRVDVGDPVDVATGDFNDTWSDLATPAFAWGLEWSRTYHSLDTTVGPLGQGWTTSYGQHVTEGANGEVTLVDAEGASYLFVPAGGGYARPADFAGDLSANDAGTAMDPEDDFFEITLFDGTVWTFDIDGYLEGIASWDGEHSVVITRTGAQVDTVTAEPSGFSLDFDHTGGRLTNVSLVGPEDPSGRDVDYGFTDGHLTSVTDAVNEVWDIDVDDFGRIVELRDPDDRVLVTNSYGAYGRVVEQTYANGSVVGFDYDHPNRATTVTSSVPGEATETLTYAWDAAGRFTGAEDADTESLTRGYDSLGNLTGATSRLRDGSNNPYELTQVPDEDGRHIESRTDFDGALTEYDWDGDLIEGVTETVDGQEHTTSYAYDPGERIPTEIEHATSTTEDPVVTDLEVVDGRVTEVVDPDGVVTENTYDPATGALLSTTVDPDDGTGDPELDLTTTYGYHPDTGEQVTVTSPESRVTTTTYDALGRVLTQAGPGEAPTVYVYKPHGQVASVTDPTGMRVSYEYDPDSGELLTETVPYDHTVVTYDPSPSSTSPTRTVNEYEDGQLMSVTEPGGAVTEYEYSILGRLDRTIVDPGGANLVIEYGYDANGNQNQITQADEDTGDGDDSVVTSTDYDPLGRPIETRDELNTLSTTEYDERGNIALLIEDPDGADPIRTEHDYDPEGRLLETRRGIDGETLDVVEQRTYTPAGRLHRLIEDPDGQNLITEYAYDAAGRQSQTIVDPDGDALTTVTALDGESRPTSVTSPAGRATTYGYVDAMGGHQETVSPPGVTPTVTVTNARGELVTQSGPDGEVSFTYDPAGNIATVTDPLEETVAYDHDDRGNRTSRTSDAGTETWTYNDANQLTAYHDPYDALDGDRLPETYLYDDLGRIERTVSDTGEWETNTYDLLGRLGQIEYSDGAASAEHTVTYAYDVLGRQSSMVDAQGTTAFTYDAHGNLTERDGPAGSEDEITATWSPGGLRESVTIAGDTTTYAYDPAGQIDQVVDPTLGTIAYTYDDDSLLTEEDLPGDEFRSWTRDPDTGQVLTYAQDASGDTRTTALTWNATGRLQSETTGGTTRTYGYDPAGQLTSEVVGDPGTGDDTLYAYDTLGRREALIQGDTTTTYAWTLETTTSSALQLTITEKGTNTVQTYDQAGRLAESDGPNEDVAYTYDTRGLPVQIDTVDGVGTTTQDRTYAGNRTLVGIDTTEPGPITTSTDLVWDHTTPGVPQIGTLTTDADTHRLAYGPEGRIGAEDPNSDSLVLPVDHLGSTIHTTETADIAHANRYDPSGEARGPAYAGVDPTFGYRGELVVANQVHLRARDYQPGLGGFISADPLGGVDGSTTVGNRHHYVNNDPLNLVDPSGLSPGDGSLTFGEVGSACDGAGGRIVAWGGDGSTHVCLEPPRPAQEGRSCWPRRTPGGDPIVVHDHACQVRTVEITCARGPSFLDPVCRNADSIRTVLWIVTAAALTVASAGAFAYAFVGIGGGTGILVATGTTGGAAALTTGGGVAVSVGVAEALGIGTAASLGAAAASANAASGPGGGNRDQRTVAQVLRGKRGSIRQAPLPQGSPSWDAILDMTMADVRAAAAANRPGFRTILKLLTDQRFNR